MGLFRRTWKIARCFWPYPEGYATVFFLRGKRTIVDTGLTYDQAKSIVDAENHDLIFTAIALIFAAAAYLSRREAKRDQQRIDQSNDALFAALDQKYACELTEEQREQFEKGRWD